MQIDIEGPAGFRRAVAALQKRTPKVAFLPAAGETIVASLECSTVKESFRRESYSTRSGGSVGALGVRVGGGSSQSTSQRVSEGLRPGDHGELIITTDRVLFLGNNQTADIPLNKIVELSPGKTGLRISVSGRRVPILLSCKKGDYALAAASIAAALRDQL